MKHFLYIKLMGVAAIIDGIIMLTIGGRFAFFQYHVCFSYTRWQAKRAKDTCAFPDYCGVESCAACHD